MRMRYLYYIESDTHIARAGHTNSRNAVKVAYEFGRAESGETVTITTKKHCKPIARAVWDVSTRKYIKVSI